MKSIILRVATNTGSGCNQVYVFSLNPAPPQHFHSRHQGPSHGEPTVRPFSQARVYRQAVGTAGVAVMVTNGGQTPFIFEPRKRRVPWQTPRKAQL